jgi:hypothetical protein
MSGENVLLTLLIGGLWGIGYVAVPVVFAGLDDKALAGMVAGRLFSVAGGLGMAAGALLLLLTVLRDRAAALQSWTARGVLLLVLLLALVQFGLAPQIEAARAAGLTDGTDFKQLHRWASAVYMAASVLGLAIVAFRGAALARPSS